MTPDLLSKLTGVGPKAPSAKPAPKNVPGVNTIEGAMRQVDEFAPGIDPELRNHIKSYLWSRAGGATGEFPKFLGEVSHFVRTKEGIEKMGQSIQRYRAARELPSSESLTKPKSKPSGQSLPSSASLRDSASSQVSFSGAKPSKNVTLPAKSAQSPTANVFGSQVPLESGSLEAAMSRFDKAGIGANTRKLVKSYLWAVNNGPEGDFKKAAAKAQSLLNQPGGVDAMRQVITRYKQQRGDASAGDPTLGLNTPDPAYDFTQRREGQSAEFEAEMDATRKAPGAAILQTLGQAVSPTHWAVEGANAAAREAYNLPDDWRANPEESPAMQAGMMSGQFAEYFIPGLGQVRMAGDIATPVVASVETGSIQPIKDAASAFVASLNVVDPKIGAVERAFRILNLALLGYGFSKSKVYQSVKDKYAKGDIAGAVAEAKAAGVDVTPDPVVREAVQMVEPNPLPGVEMREPSGLPANPRAQNTRPAPNAEAPRMARDRATAAEFDNLVRDAFGTPEPVPPTGLPANPRPQNARPLPLPGQKDAPRVARERMAGQKPKVDAKVSTSDEMSKELSNLYRTRQNLALKVVEINPTHGLEKVPNGDGQKREYAFKKNASPEDIQALRDIDNEIEILSDRKRKASADESYERTKAAESEYGLKEWTEATVTDLDGKKVKGQLSTFVLNLDGQVQGIRFTPHSNLPQIDIPVKHFDRISRTKAPAKPTATQTPKPAPKPRAETPATTAPAAKAGQWQSADGTSNSVMRDVTPEGMGPAKASEKVVEERMRGESVEDAINRKIGYQVDNGIVKIESVGDSWVVSVKQTGGGVKKYSSFKKQQAVNEAYSELYSNTQLVAPKALPANPRPQTAKPVAGGAAPRMARERGAVDAKGEKHYIFIERNGKRVPIAGPFVDAAEASRAMRDAQDWAKSQDRWAHFDTYSQAKTSNTQTQAAIESHLSKRGWKGDVPTQAELDAREARIEASRPKNPEREPQAEPAFTKTPKTETVSTDALRAGDEIVLPDGRVTKVKQVLDNDIVLHDSGSFSGRKSHERVTPAPKPSAPKSAQAKAEPVVQQKAEATAKNVDDVLISTSPDGRSSMEVSYRGPGSTPDSSVVVDIKTGAQFQVKNTQLSSKSKQPEPAQKQVRRLTVGGADFYTGGAKTESIVSSPVNIGAPSGMDFYIGRRSVDGRWVVSDGNMAPVGFGNTRAEAIAKAEKFFNRDAPAPKSAQAKADFDAALADVKTHKPKGNVGSGLGGFDAEYARKVGVLVQKAAVYGYRTVEEAVVAINKAIGRKLTKDEESLFRQKWDEHHTPKKTHTKADEPFVPVKDATGLARQFDDAERAALGLAVTSKKAHTVSELADMGKTLAERGNIQVRIQKSIEGSKGLTPKEVAAAAHYKREVFNEYNDLAAKMQKATGADAHEIAQRMREIEGEMANISEAAQNTRTQWHELGMSLQVAYQPDYSLATLVARAKEAGAGAELSPAMRSKVEAYAKRISELEAQLAGVKPKVEAEVMKAAGNMKVEQAVKSRNSALNWLRKVGIIAGEAKPTGTAKNKQAGFILIPRDKLDATARAIRQLARSYIADGSANSLDTVLANLRRDVPGIDDSQSLMMLSSEYRNTILEADVAKLEIDASMRRLRSEADRKTWDTAKKIRAGAWDILNGAQRTFQAGMDISAPFLQGRKILTNLNASGWARGWVPMMKALAKGEGEALKVAADIKRRPMYARARKAGLELTDGNGAFVGREETFHSHIVDKLKKVPVLKLYAHALENSEAAYNAFLNSVRMDTFEKLAAKAGDDPDYLRDVARMVNIATGRGDGKVAKMLGNEVAGALFYAPRFAWSNIQSFGTMGGTFGARSDLGRKVAFSHAARGAAVSAAGIGLASLFGDVELDARSADFGKVTFPDGTQVDILGKTSDPIKLAVQTIWGRSSRKGNYDAPRFGNNYASMWLEGKASPGVRLLLTLRQGEYYNNRTGEPEPITLVKALKEQLSPLGWRDVSENALGNDATPLSRALSPLSLAGGNVGRKMARDESAKSAPPFSLVPPGLQKVASPAAPTSAAEKAAKKLASSWGNGKTEEQSAMEDELVEAIAAKDRKKVSELSAKLRVNKTDFSKYVKEAYDPPLIRYVQRLTLKEAMAVFEKATPKERETIAKLYGKKFENEKKKGQMPPAEFKKYADQFKALAPRGR